MSPGDVLVMFPTCFEGTFSLRKASVIVIPMASFIVSSFGDVHKRCMKVLPLSLRFFFPGSRFCINQRNVFTEHLHGHAGAGDKHTPDDNIGPARRWRAATGFNGKRAGDVNQVAFETSLSLTRVILVNTWLPLHY